MYIKNWVSIKYSNVLKFYISKSNLKQNYSFKLSEEIYKKKELTQMEMEMEGWGQVLLIMLLVIVSLQSGDPRLGKYFIYTYCTLATALGFFFVFGN